MLHNITGEPSILNQPTPTSYYLGLRVGLGQEAASLLAEVWEELGGETPGGMPHLSLPQADIPGVRPHGMPKPSLAHSEPPAEKESSERWQSQSVLPLPQTGTKKIL